MLKLIVIASFLALCLGQDVPMELDDLVQESEVDDSLNNTELVLAFVVIRHGDRTPDYDELVLSPSTVDSQDVFFPYGMKALTNEGKRRSFKVGQYLRRRYEGFLSKLYIKDEVQMRTTNFERTKMTALCVLAGLYPPEELQQWHSTLLWQPIPYDTPSVKDDDLHYWYNCPRYLWLRDQAYKLPEIQKRLIKYQEFFQTLSSYTKTNITTPEDVFFLDNLFQALGNVGVEEPHWAKETKAKIKELTKVEYGIEFYTDEMMQIAAGVFMRDFVMAMESAAKGEEVEPKMRIFSAHENNVAAIMAAARVFKPHQPAYGSTISLEFRRHKITGKYAVVAVYLPEPKYPEKVLKVSGCGDKELCDYKTFLRLTANILMTREKFFEQCPKKE